MHTNPEYRATAEIGEVRLLRGQRYVLDRIEPYLRQRDGRQTELLVWQTHCAECGVAFEVKTSRTSPKFEPSRRCKEHARPGKRA